MCSHLQLNCHTLSETQHPHWSVAGILHYPPGQQSVSGYIFQQHVLTLHIHGSQQMIWSLNNSMDLAAVPKTHNMHFEHLFKDEKMISKVRKMKLKMKSIWKQLLIKNCFFQANSQFPLLKMPAKNHES